MKQLIMFSLLVVFTIGATIGQALGVNPILSGVGFTAGVAGIQHASKFSMKGIAMTGVPDMAVLVAQIGEYFQKYSNTIFLKATSDITFENYMAGRGGVTSQYVSTSARFGKFLQPYQREFTPAGGVQFVPYIGTARMIKMDGLIDNMDELWNSYLYFLADEAKAPKDYPFVVWYVNQIVIPGIKEEINAISVNGAYVAPTAGTPGDSIESTDGVFTIITNEIDDDNITPVYLTGTLTTSNVYDKVKAFQRSLPSVYKKQKGIIFMSEEIAEWYVDAFTQEHGTMMDYKGEANRLRVYGTNFEIQPLAELNGSQRLLSTPVGPQGNLLKLYDQITLPSAFRVQEFDRSVKLLGEFKRGYSFETLELVFCNEQD